MTLKRLRLLGLAVLAVLLVTASGLGQIRPAPTPIRPGTPTKPGTPSTSTAPKFTPKFEAWAETRLLMEGLAGSNYRSLSKLLKDRPADTETWIFARGQALLLAETGNLLLLRPPRNTGRDTWMKLSMEMRDEAGKLAQSIGNRDYARSKAGLTDVANACNRCHTTFRVPIRVHPDAGETERGVAFEQPVD